MFYRLKESFVSYFLTRENVLFHYLCSVEAQYMVSNHYELFHEERLSPFIISASVLGIQLTSRLLYSKLIKPTVAWYIG